MNTTAPAPAAVLLPMRSFYQRVTALGFGLLALTGVVALIIGLLNGDLAGSAGFAIAFVVIGLLLGGAVWRWGRWMLVVTAVLSLALVGLLGPFSLFTLAHPESAADFVPIVLLLAGSVLGLIGSVGALVQWRRKTARAAGTPAERTALFGILGVAGAAILLSIILTVAGRATVAAEAKTGATSVQMKNFAFNPQLIPVTGGDTVRLVVKNDDTTLHTFTLPQAGVNVAVPPGSEKLIEFKAPAAGTYVWFCIPHSSENGGTRAGMVGTLQAK